MANTVDTWSLDALFRQHHQELSRFACSRLGCPEDAVDVVQDAFVRYASLSQTEAVIGNETPIIAPRFFLSCLVSSLT